MKTNSDLWDVWKVHYGTCAEVEQFGDRRRELVARHLPFERAMQMIRDLGFGHSVHHHLQFGEAI